MNNINVTKKPEDIHTGVVVNQSNATTDTKGVTNPTKVDAKADAFKPTNEEDVVNNVSYNKTGSIDEPENKGKNINIKV